MRLVWDWKNLASSLVSIFGHDLFSVYFDADQGSAVLLKRRQWMSFCLQDTAGAVEDQRRIKLLDFASYCGLEGGTTQ